ATSCAVATTKHESDGPDLGDEATTSDALKLGTLVPLTFNTKAVANLGTTQWYGYRLHGSSGQKISIFADAGVFPSVVDSVVYLYKVSAAGHVYGKPIASNDDFTGPAFSKNKYSSNIANFALPETRDYAIVVTSYEQSSKGNVAVWWTTGKSTPTSTTTVKV